MTTQSTSEPTGHYTQSLLEGADLHSSTTRIDRIEAWLFDQGSPLPGLMLIQLHDSDGLTGVGETFYAPHACWESIAHLWAPRLAGRPLGELLEFYAESSRAVRKFVGLGAEYRALSALDVAFWDLAAKRLGLPMRDLLSPNASDQVAVYNSCVGPSYTSTARVPGEGNVDVSDSRDDYGAWMTDAGSLARELVSEGFAGMKFWPFDFLAKEVKGDRPSPEALRAAALPLRQVREAVGQDIDIMIDGHGLWGLAGAIDVARECEKYNVRWVEDLVIAHPLDDLVNLKAATTVPILASEYLAAPDEYQALLAAEAADIVMVDPTWAGGITNGVAVARMAANAGLPVSYHDCTGPVTLLAGACMTAAVANRELQELARGLFSHVYPTVADMDCELERGFLRLGTEPGLGVTPKRDLNGLPGVRYHQVQVG